MGKYFLAWILGVPAIVLSIIYLISLQHRFSSAFEPGLAHPTSLNSGNSPNHRT